MLDIFYIFDLIKRSETSLKLKIYLTVLFHYSIPGLHTFNFTAVKYALLALLDYYHEYLKFSFIGNNSKAFMKVWILQYYIMYHYLLDFIKLLKLYGGTFKFNFIIG